MKSRLVGLAVAVLIGVALLGQTAGAYDPTDPVHGGTTPTPVPPTPTATPYDPTDPVNGGPTPTPVPDIEDLEVSYYEEGTIITEGFNPEGFAGDIAAAMAQAMGTSSPELRHPSVRWLHRAPTPTSGSVKESYPTYCRTYTAYREGRHKFGYLLWRFNHSIYWCYNYHTMLGTPISWVWPSNVAIGWQYGGQISSPVQYWSYWPYRYYVWKQGKFRLCLSTWCIQESHPWVSLMVNQIGTGSWQAGG